MAVVRMVAAVVPRILCVAAVVVMEACAVVNQVDATACLHDVSTIQEGICNEKI